MVPFHVILLFYRIPIDLAKEVALGSDLDIPTDSVIENFNHCSNEIPALQFHR